MKMPYKLGTRSQANLAGVHDKLRLVVARAIVLSTQDFGVVGKAVRTAAEQNALFKQGVTTKDGYKRKSNHQPRADGFGYAVDLTPYSGGAYILDDRAHAMYPHIASAMSRAAKELGVRIKWGSNWYEAMNDYGSTPADMIAAVERYKAKHPGPDFIDGPHYEML
jgi:peptidoglycan LD-endopeptidase CwlK